MFWAEYTHTVFRRINVLGAEAENEPLTLSDLNENDCVNPFIPVQWFLKYGQVKPNVRGAFIQAGTFIRQNTVHIDA